MTRLFNQYLVALEEKACTKEKKKTNKPRKRKVKKYSFFFLPLHTIFCK